MSLLLITTPNKCVFNAGGIRKIILTERSAISGFNFTDDNFNIITGFQFPIGTEPFWIVFETNGDITQLSEQINQGRNGETYDIDLTTNLVELKEENRGFVEELTVNGIAAIVEDRNGRFWLLGEDAPARLTAYEAGTDTAGGVAQYSFSISLTSRFKMREVDAAAVAGLNVLITDCSQYSGSQVQAVPGPVGAYYNCFVNDFF